MAERDAARALGVEWRRFTWVRDQIGRLLTSQRQHEDQRLLVGGADAREARPRRPARGGPRPRQPPVPGGAAQGALDAQLEKLERDRQLPAPQAQEMRAAGVGARRDRDAAGPPGPGPAPAAGAAAEGGAAGPAPRRPPVLRRAERATRPAPPVTAARARPGRRAGEGLDRGVSSTMMSRSATEAGPVGRLGRVGVERPRDEAGPDSGRRHEEIRCVAVVLLTLAVSASAKEYQSSFGFTVDIPDNWLALTKLAIEENPALAGAPGANVGTHRSEDAPGPQGEGRERLVRDVLRPDDQRCDVRGQHQREVGPGEDPGYP